MPLPSRIGHFRHLEKRAALPIGERGGKIGKSNELRVFLNVLFICGLYNIAIRFSVKPRAIKESVGADF